MKNIFAGIPAPKVKKSKFDLSHDVKLSGDMGWLIPVLMMDVLPGENIRNKSTFMARFAPMLAPILHLITATIHFFYTPNRILYDQDDEWENFIYAGVDGLNNSTMPMFEPTSVAQEIGTDEALFKKIFGIGSLWDYLGLPLFDFDSTLSSYQSLTAINAYPWMVYQKIYNEYYRDETLMSEVPVAASSGYVNTSTFINGLGLMRRKCWKKDQFTSALPWPQRGADVLIPLEADVEYKSVSEVFQSSGASAGDTELMARNNVGTIPDRQGELMNASDGRYRIENIESVTNGTITINDFRVAVVVQRWAEANARGGYRENEGSLSHFGVIVPDYRLKHPEYIGGGSQIVQISEVLATATSEDAESNILPQGNMAGHGIAVGNSNTFSWRVPEHGWITGILCVMPKAAYQQGIPKKYLKSDRFDLAWPEFVGLGEQEILSKELYWDITDTDDTNNDELFGYQQRYWEYKYESDRVCGDFRTTLDFWHMGRIFDERPVLDEEFLTGAPTKRVFAVEDEDVHSLWMVVHHQISALRPMPYYSVPGLSKI